MKKFAMIVAMTLLLAACGEYAMKGAGKGAASGAAAGAAGGMVTALIFGGDPLEAAARGAAYSAAAGATMGAMSGSQTDAQISEKKKAQAEKIRQKIGDDAFKGLTALVTCDRADTLQYAASAQQSSNPNYAVAGYWLELLNYADQGDNDKAASLTQQVLSKDWDTNTEADAQKKLGELQTELVNLRKQYKVKPDCS